ncbi:MAG TPA: hypothetical protein VGD60_02805 [Candidatus Acidoferrales bacterium]
MFRPHHCFGYGVVSPGSKIRAFFRKLEAALQRLQPGFGQIPEGDITDAQNEAGGFTAKFWGAEQVGFEPARGAFEFQGEMERPEGGEAEAAKERD